MVMRKLRAKVYLRAAELIDKEETTYSCLAIDDALEELGISEEEDRGIHRAHYIAMFRGKKEVQVAFDGVVDSWYIDAMAGDRATLHHPFWDKAWTRERKECRVLALLFMAEIARG